MLQPTNVVPLVKSAVAIPIFKITRIVDESGEILHIIIGAIIGGTVNLIYKVVSGQVHSFKDGLVAGGIGAVAGGVGAATGGLAFAAAGGAASTAAMMPIQSAGNTLYFGDPFITWENYVLGIAGGALTGGIGNGTVAALKGNNFWTGKDVQFGKGTFSFNNTATRPAPEMKLLEAPTPSLEVKQPTIGAINDKISEMSTASKQQGTYSVYQGVDPSGDVRYIGITSRAPEVRFSEHLNSGTNRATLNYSPMDKTGTLNQMNARIQEQSFINKYGLQKNGDQLYN